MPKPKRHPWVRFFSLFALLYLVLVLPWPGWREAHARGFCALARLVLPAESGQRILRVDTVPPASRNHTLDTRLTIANRAQLAQVARSPEKLDEILLPWQANLLRQEPSLNPNADSSAAAPA